MPQLSSLAFLSAVVGCQRCSHSLFAFSTDALLGFNLCKEPCRC
ncbi:unnamed protein product [Rhodiola kirilowii]